MLIAGGRLASALIALATIRAVTSYLTPAQYGELALLLAVQMFCGLFLVNPIGQHINLHTHMWWDDGTLSIRLNLYQKYVVAVSLVGGFAVLGMSKQDSAEHLLVAAATMVAMIIAGTWNATLIPMLNMLGLRAASVSWGIVTAVVSLVSSIFLVVWLPSATAWLAGQAVGMALGALGAKYVFKRHATQQLGISNPGSVPELIDKQTILAYCLPLAFATGLMWIQMSGYRVVIEKYWGLELLGFLAVGLQVAGQIFALAESLATQFLYPMFFRQVSAKGMTEEVTTSFSDLLNTLAPLYLVLTGLVVLSAPSLLKILVAPKFHDAMLFVMLGAAIELCRVLGNLLSNAAHVRRKTRSLALPYAIGAITSLALIFLVGMYQKDIVWAGVALTVGAVSMLAVMWGSMMLQIPIKLDLFRWAAGAAVMLAMAMFAICLAMETKLIGDVLLLVLGTMVAAIAGIALLWKNPATIRLLSVRIARK